ncbi:MAG: YihY/virulence factor BrkB family protein [Dehalococcoidia bacterium]|nr:YihY/virulence factor BrkB family protein [Dehalococcoidia bacterium]
MKSRTIRLLKESLTEFGTDNGTLLAASVSFNLLLSIFPLALAVVYIAGSFPQSPYTQDQIIRGIAYLMPVSRELIASTVTGVAAARGAIGILALIGLIWGGFGFFNTIRRALNTAWGIRKPAPLLKSQLINLTMMIGAAILLFLSVLITVFLSTVSEQVIQVAGAEVVNRSVVERILANVLATAIAFLVFLLLYRFVPSIRPKWKDIWIGAVAAAVSFEIIKVIFLIYLRIFNPYNLVYGSIGALIAFLMWTYLSALIFLFIAKVTHVNLEMRSREKA